MRMRKGRLMIRLRMCAKVEELWQPAQPWWHSFSRSRSHWWKFHLETSKFLIVSSPESPPWKFLCENFTRNFWRGGKILIFPVERLSSSFKGTSFVSQRTPTQPQNKQGSTRQIWNNTENNNSLAALTSSIQSQATTLHLKTEKFSYILGPSIGCFKNFLASFTQLVKAREGRVPLIALAC